MSRAVSTDTDLANRLPSLPSRVLYIQHARELGGSAVSLKYLAGSMLEAGVDCTVALARPSPELYEFYSSAGIRTLAVDGISCWHHSTVARRALWNPRHVAELCGVATSWRSAREATSRLVDRVKPDLVHLNSMPLCASASVLSAESIPFVWHVREPPPDQGLRTAIIRSLMLAAPAVVFITDHDRELWVGRAAGVTVANAVPDAWFQGKVRQPMRSNGVVRFAYLGGLKIEAKGARTLLAALQILRDKVPGWQCVMPGAIGDETDWSHQIRLGSLARAAGVAGRAERLRTGFQRLVAAVELLPRTSRIQSILEDVDFVVFPAVRPHFARPVIEAAALGVPAVGSELGGVVDCIVHRETGLLYAPGDPRALAAALGEMIANAAFRREAGARARDRAKRFYSLSVQQRAIARIYRQVLAKNGPAGPDARHHESPEQTGG